MEVGKPTAFAVGLLLVGSLVTNAYLLGRDNGRRHAQQPQPVAAAQPVAGQPVATSPTPAVAPMPSPVPLPDVPPPVAVATPPPSASPPTTVAVAEAPNQSGEAAEVRSYFQRMDQLAGVNPFGSDAQGTAEKLLASAMSGDTSGFDGMIKLASDARTKAEAITPPSACRAYHGELLNMLSTTASLLGDLKSALKSGNAEALAGMAAQAQSLQMRAQSLEASARDIKQRYGIR